MRSLGLRNFVTGLVCAFLFALGCAPSLEGNQPREPKKDVPSNFSAKAGKSKQSSGTQSWSAFFADPALHALIETALKNNQELSIQLQEIIIANSEIIARKGEYWPKVSAGVGVGVEKVGKYTSQGASDEAHDVPENLPDFQFGFSASWELDIWKKLRNSAQSAVYSYLASIEGKNLMVTRIVAEIANSYYDLLAFDKELVVLKQNIELQQSGLEVVRLQKEAARVTELAVQRFEAELLKNRSRQFALEQEIIQAENRINFLVGRFPQHVDRSSEKFDDAMPKIISTGLPSDLLENRPDVRQAELELAAAKLDVEVAKARFYPAISIDAGVGYRAFNPVHLVDTPQSLLYNLAGNISAPLLNRQAIKADYFAANAAQIKAVYNYERTILQAFTDVVNQLAMIENLKQSYDLQSQQVDKLVSSIEVSNVLFRSARADYMEVLLTRRDSLESQMQLIETRLRQLHAAVNIYQSLGGGWR